MQVLERLQAAFDLVQTLGKHVLGNPHRLARASEQPGNLALVAGHEVGLVLIERCQRLADLNGSGHQLGFLTRTGRAVVRITDDEQLTRLVALGKGRIKPVQPSRQVAAFAAQLNQHLLAGHAARHYIEARFQRPRGCRYAWRDTGGRREAGSIRGG
ncbi:hypothetical protein D3C77_445640 [compost metagenome]